MAKVICRVAIAACAIFYTRRKNHQRANAFLLLPFPVMEEGGQVLSPRVLALPETKTPCENAC